MTIVEPPTPCAFWRRDDLNVYFNSDELRKTYDLNISSSGLNFSPFMTTSPRFKNGGIRSLFCSVSAIAKLLDMTFQYKSWLRVRLAFEIWLPWVRFRTATTIDMVASKSEKKIEKIISIRDWKCLVPQMCLNTQLGALYQSRNQKCACHAISFTSVIFTSCPIVVQRAETLVVWKQWCVFCVFNCTYCVVLAVLRHLYRTLSCGIFVW